MYRQRERESTQRESTERERERERERGLREGERDFLLHLSFNFLKKKLKKRRYIRSVLTILQSLRFESLREKERKRRGDLANTHFPLSVSVSFLFLLFFNIER